MITFFDKKTITTLDTTWMLLNNRKYRFKIKKFLIIKIVLGFNTKFPKLIKLFINLGKKSQNIENIIINLCQLKKFRAGN